MKKTGIFLLSMLSILVVAVSVHAIPMVPGYNAAYLNNAETWIDKDGDGQISSGDIFWGIFNIQNIKAPTDPSGSFGPEIWYSGSSPAEITGYFLLQVDETIPGGAPGGTTDLIKFKPASSDPNNILTPYLSSEAVVAIYTDTVKNYDDSNIPTGLATATDGTLEWILGMGPSTDGDSSGGYWYSYVPITPPGSNSPVGDAYAGLNFITPAGDIFVAIDDPNETVVNVDVEFWLNSELFQVYDVTYARDNNLFPFSSNDPAVYHPVPEPSTMLLVGSALIGVAGIMRRKIKK